MMHRFPFFVMRRQRPVMEVSDTHTYSPSNKRRKIQIESSCQFSFFESVCDSETVEGKPREKEPRFKIDRFKKFQFSCNLMRLIEHPDGKEFNDGIGLISGVLELNPMDIIKTKLDKDMYFETDEFAADIRLMFSDSILKYPLNHKIHIIAKQLQELFEKNWKSLEERWETEKREEEESRMQKMMKKPPEPSTKLTQSSVEEQNCGEEICDNFLIPFSLHNQSGFAKEEGRRSCSDADSLNAFKQLEIFF